MSILDAISEMFSADFIVRAIIVGISVSLCSALLGVSLVLKRFSMIGDGLSHVGFGALAIAAALGLAPLVISIPLVIVIAILLLRLTDNDKINGDTAIALISCSALAIGVMVVSVSTGMNTDVYNYMFGSIVALSSNDTYISIALSVVIGVIYVLFYNRIFAVTFDETFQKAVGVKAGSITTLIAVLTAITVVLGMRMMGALLISGLIIFPCLISMRLFKTFKGVVICSAVVSVFSFVFGTVCAYILDTPVGATVVIVNILLLVLSFVIEKIICRRKIKRQKNRLTAI